MCNRRSYHESAAGREEMQRLAGISWLRSLIDEILDKSVNEICLLKLDDMAFVGCEPVLRENVHREIFRHYNDIIFGSIVGSLPNRAPDGIRNAIEARRGDSPLARYLFDEDMHRYLEEILVLFSTLPLDGVLEVRRKVLDRFVGSVRPVVSAMQEGVNRINSKTGRALYGDLENRPVRGRGWFGRLSQADQTNLEKAMDVFKTLVRDDWRQAGGLRGAAKRAIKQFPRYVLKMFFKALGFVSGDVGFRLASAFGRTISSQGIMIPSDSIDAAARAIKGSIERKVGAVADNIPMHAVQALFQLARNGRDKEVAQDIKAILLDSVPTGTDIATTGRAIVEAFHVSLKDLLDDYPDKDSIATMLDDIPGVEYRGLGGNGDVFSIAQLLLDSNMVFSRNDVLYRPDRFIPRNDLIEDLMSFMKDARDEENVGDEERRPLYILVGSLGYGKTWNMVNFAHRIISLRRAIPVLVNARQYKGSIDRWLACLENRAQPRYPESLIEFMGRHPQQKILLIIDGADELVNRHDRSDFWTAIHDTLIENPRVAPILQRLNIVVTCRLETYMGDIENPDIHQILDRLSQRQTYHPSRRYYSRDLQAIDDTELLGYLDKYELVNTPPRSFSESPIARIPVTIRLLEQYKDEDEGFLPGFDANSPQGSVRFLFGVDGSFFNPRTLFYRLGITTDALIVGTNYLFEQAITNDFFIDLDLDTRYEPAYEVMDHAGLFETGSVRRDRVFRRFKQLWHPFIRAYGDYRQAIRANRGNTLDLRTGTFRFNDVLGRGEEFVQEAVEICLRAGFGLDDGDLIGPEGTDPVIEPIHEPGNADNRKLGMLGALLESYLNRTPNIIFARVVSVDGQEILSKIKKKKATIDGDLLSRISAIVLSSLRQIKAESRTDTNSTFDMGTHRLVFLEAGYNSLLLTVADLFANLDDIYPYAYLCAEKIARILDDRFVETSMPLINLGSIHKEMASTVGGKIKQMKFEPGDYVFKLVIAGDWAVGKTTLVQKFLQERFNDNYLATIGANIMSKDYKLRGEDDFWHCQFSIWDLGGVDLFKRARKSYFFNAEAGIIVFDVTRRETFEHVKTWMLEFQVVGKPIPIVLVGNKVDLAQERQVSMGDAEALAKELYLSYVETSVKDGSNVEEVFEMLAYFLVKANFLQAKNLDL